MNGDGKREARQLNAFCWAVLATLALALLAALAVGVIIGATLGLPGWLR